MTHYTSEFVEGLKDPAGAADYISAALWESDAAFSVALHDVAEARLAAPEPHDGVNSTLNRRHSGKLQGHGTQIPDDAGVDRA